MLRDKAAAMRQATARRDEIMLVNPLTYDDLFQPFQEASKPVHQWAIGTESERFGIHKVDGAPVHYHGPGGVLDIFEILTSRFGWSPAAEVEGGPTIMLHRGDASITLEPGGQVELSGAPLPDIHQVHEETRLHLSEMSHVSETLGLTWMAIGFQPFARQADLDWVPKHRYAIMREYLASRGRHALDMMRRTATVQVNFDYSDAVDAVEEIAGRVATFARCVCHVRQLTVCRGTVVRRQVDADACLVRGGPGSAGFAAMDVERRGELARLH